MSASGVGVYLRGLGHKSQGSPQAAAKKAADHGVSFVALMAIWQNGDRTLWSNGRDPALLVRYAEAFAAAGVDVWLWGYPWAGRHPEYIDRLADVTDACGGVVNGWLHDPELGYQPRKNGLSPAVTRASARELRILAGASELAQGVTSYGMAAGHRAFPWQEWAGMGFGSPQLYTVGPAEVDRGIAQWRELGWSRIVPSVPLYGRRSGAHLHDHLSAFVDGDEDVDGLLFWSWRQGSVDEWRVLERWSRWLDRGMCVAA